MLTSLLRPTRQRPRGEDRPLLPGRQGRSAPVQSESEESSSYEEEDGSGNRHGMRDTEALLPIFSAAHLDRIPVYHLQHTIRILIVRKVETTLSWDQLRTPQISQFLVKPLQQEIRADHYTKATLYALLANCLQFQKEGQLNPGTVGVSSTRALMCELLAMRLMREFSTRELIDVLFYDFDPLQGLPNRLAASRSRGTKYSLARLSTVEIAIRAHAKRFLAHPLVVQQFEAVWAGTIVFHSIADTLHRQPRSQPTYIRNQYGATSSQPAYRAVTYEDAMLNKSKSIASPDMLIRKTVTLYDPSDASLFKLSRLRVPRYRQFFSTLSFAVMLGLFLAVLAQRSLDITALELVFWFWSAGYMLDEVVGFSEQGFGLYIISVWNSFDIGILLLFITYYILRLYGILMPDVQKKHIASMAYDVLASTAILLFPRLFSVLDHYRYFSQLLIAFRMMAVDLAAVLILIVISCSGFFVAFTLSFNDIDKPFNASSAAYALFQILMGFTPAAWEVWGGYNILGKTILAIFLIICHFLIVTILITVLTNSFLAVVQNANEEHQFLFAVNTISMVKSDALFSYVPPTNILGWVLSPLRFVLPFKRFVRFNRTMIKMTHVPILFGIFLYERLVLSRKVIDPTDLVDQRGRESSRAPAFTLRGAETIFSPGARLREPSVTTFHKDQALEEVFRRAPQDASRQGTFADNHPRRESLLRNKSTTVVQDWMQGLGQDGAASPIEEEQSILDRLEARRPPLRRYRTTHAGPVGSFHHVPRSVTSVPEDHQPFSSFSHIHQDMSMDDIPQQTDQDGDDELATNDDEDGVTRTSSSSHPNDDSDKENLRTHRKAGVASGKQRKPLGELSGSSNEEDDNATDPKTPIATQIRTMHPGEGVDLPESPERPVTQQRMAPPSRQNRGQHIRTASSATILFAPLAGGLDGSTSKDPISTSPIKSPSKSRVSRTSAQASKQASSGIRTPRRSRNSKNPTLASTDGASDHYPPFLPSRRSILGDRQRSTPNLTSFLSQDRRKPSFNAMALDLASDLGDNRAVPNAELLSTSFGTQLEMAMRRPNIQRPHGNPRQSGRRGFNIASVFDEDDDEDDEEDEEDEHSAFRSGPRMNRLMLERMSLLEESFRDMLREVKGLASNAGGSRARSLVEAPIKEEVEGIDRARPRASGSV
ncbi:hypothetical protein BT63DRAFT_183694 [Microthyrium microscopicum]|uniref:Ion transport domain-containing protein n=1 Tax=Microthyrium microscopicum TaxID=703497 RepID=A0A6A6UI13_9PEZI|nr:hypothetical protein BT63DRAFT_183694 [Microthyrium microscopicum]